MSGYIHDCSVCVTGFRRAVSHSSYHPTSRRAQISLPTFVSSQYGVLQAKLKQYDLVTMWRCKPTIRQLEACLAKRFANTVSTLIA